MPITGRAGTERRSTNCNYTASTVRCIGGLCDSGYRIARLEDYHGRMQDLKYFDTHRRATWLELFFDLIFVVAVGDSSKKIRRRCKLSRATVLT